MRIVSATNNKNKLREIREILSDYEIIPMEELGINIDVIEDCDTFVGNAKKKAFETYELVKEPVIADDSGLCIDYLDGFPGIASKRFLDDVITDHESTPEERNSYLLEKLIDAHDRSASIKCVIAYYDGIDYIIGEGILTGTIAYEMRGENGFGFDAIFELPSGKTTAELSAEEKNLISHRKLALEDLRMKLKNKE